MNSDKIVIEESGQIEHFPYWKRTILNIKGDTAGIMIQTIGYFHGKNKNDRARISFETTALYVKKFTELEKKIRKIKDNFWHWMEEIYAKDKIVGSVYDDWEVKLENAYKTHARFVKECTKDLEWEIEDRDTGEEK